MKPEQQLVAWPLQSRTTSGLSTDQQVVKTVKKPTACLLKVKSEQLVACPRTQTSP